MKSAIMGTRSKVKLLFCLVLVSSFLIVVGCSKDDGDIQSYDIRVVDGITDEGINDAVVSLFWAVGGKVLDIAEDRSDQEGFVTLKTTVQQDTVQQLIVDNSSLNGDLINQTISVEKEGYLLYELFQDIPLPIIRPSLEEDELILAKVYKYIPATLKMVDAPPLRAEQVIFQYEIFQSHPKFSFPSYGGTLNVFSPDSRDTMTQALFLADGVDYRIEYALSTVEGVMGELDTFFQSFVEFEGALSLEGEDILIKF